MISPGSTEDFFRHGTEKPCDLTWLKIYDLEPAFFLFPFKFFNVVISSLFRDCAPSNVLWHDSFCLSKSSLHFW